MKTKKNLIQRGARIPAPPDRSANDLNFKSKGCLIFPILARLSVYYKKINAYGKEYNSTSRSVRSDRNPYREKLD